MISLIVISIVTIKPFQFKLRYTNDELLINACNWPKCSSINKLPLIIGIQPKLIIKHYKNNPIV